MRILCKPTAPRGKQEREYELIDTGIFDEDRYFDVFVEYARINPTAVNILVTVWNRGPEEATLHLLPQLWFRNTWSWKIDAKRPRISAGNPQSVDVIHHELGAFQFFVEKADEWLFTENETNARRLFGQELEGYFKDAFHEYVVNGNASATNPARAGTKAAALLVRSVSPGGRLQLRACLREPSEGDPFETFDEIIETRRAEADAFYTELQTDLSDDDARLVQRQALAGLIWSKQYFYYDVPEWLDGDPRSRRPLLNAGMAATTTGNTSTMPTSSRCRTNGSIHGTPPGIWRSTRSPSPWSTPNLPSPNSCS